MGDAGVAITVRRRKPTKSVLGACKCPSESVQNAQALAALLLMSLLLLQLIY